MTAEQIIKLLKLVPHPEEGGFFIESYRSEEKIPITSLPNRYSGDRNFGTCIYYLLTPTTFSTMHKLQSDEIFHFYLGDPVEMLNLYEDGKGKIITIGNNLENAELPQVVVKKNVWQGAALKEGGKFALLGTTVSPGFEFIDYETAKKEVLISAFPDFKEKILKLTK